MVVYVIILPMSFIVTVENILSYQDNICSNAKSYADTCNAAGYPVDGWRSK